MRFDVCANNPAGPGPKSRGSDRVQVSDWQWGERRSRGSGLKAALCLAACFGLGPSIGWVASLVTSSGRCQLYLDDEKDQFNDCFPCYLGCEPLSSWKALAFSLLLGLEDSIARAMRKPCGWLWAFTFPGRQPVTAVAGSPSQLCLGMKRAGTEEAVRLFLDRAALGRGFLGVVQREEW